jgi:hypothetical protein
MIASFALCVAIPLVLRQSMVLMNKKKDRNHGASTNDTSHTDSGDVNEFTVEQLQIDETDWKNKEMKYSL